MLIWSFLLYTLVLYEFYTFFFVVWTDYLFDFAGFTTTQLIAYYTYYEFIEIFVLLFARTRITIRYFPRIITVLNVVYLAYYFTYFYPFSSEALLSLVTASLMVCAGFLLWCECPAQEWNPFAPYTPTERNPRQAYTRVLQSEFSLNTSLISLLTPPAFRSEFDPEERVCIDADDYGNILFDFSLGARDNLEQVELITMEMNAQNLRQGLQPNPDAEAAVANTGNNPPE